MVLSTEIPKATLKTSMVEALIGMPTYPIMAAVMIWGITFGTNAISTIRLLLNIQAIKPAIRIIARAKDENKLEIRY